MIKAAEMHTLQSVLIIYYAYIELIRQRETPCGGKTFPNYSRIKHHVVSRRTLQCTTVPHFRKQAARCMGRITRRCTSGQNGAAYISIMAFRLRFPRAAELSHSSSKAMHIKVAAFR